ncbi:MAG: hypothetical protein HY319_07680 [Armatimonadetes bacterium]|nr:hypothetical protein [Armatimonadota bacterium]
MQRDRKKRADPQRKETIRELLGRMRLGILPPRYCKYTDADATIEFGQICHLFKAISEAQRSEVALCVQELFEEGQFASKEWITEEDEDGSPSYRYPVQLVVPLE